MNPEQEARIRSVLEDADSVRFAYLFGSEALGRAGATSDIDIGVFLDPALSNEDRFDLRLRLIAKLVPAVAPKPVDLIVLNNAPPALAFSVLSTGQLLFCREPLLRFDFAWKSLARYHDRRFYDRRYTRLALVRNSIP